MADVLEPTLETLGLDEAATRRFFYNQANPELVDVCRAQQDTAAEALGAMAKLEQAEAVIRAGRANLDKLDNARWDMMDQGAVFRRQADRLSSGIARSLPSRQLGTFVLGAGIFSTSERSLLEKQDKLTIYQSFVAQHELERGHRIANRQQWSSLMLTVLLA